MYQRIRADHRSYGCRSRLICAIGHLFPRATAYDSAINRRCSQSALLERLMAAQKIRGERHETMKAVGIWVRVSTEDQAHGESPEHHEKRARYFLEAKGWKVAELYDLSGVSGKSVMDHPETKRMQADVRSGRISALVFSKLARLARNTKELLELSDFFREHDADLISLQESIDTSSPAGRLFYTVIAALAEWERAEISSRVAASVPIRAKLGKPIGGQAPFGYQWVDKKLVPDPKEAPVRKLMFELFVEHRRRKTVARLLNDRGLRTRNGAKFSDTTVERLLRDPTAKGLRRANYTKTANSKKAWELKPESEWIYLDVEPIISDELWASANSILDARRGTKPKRVARKTVHLFAGLATCQCGGKMYVPSNTPKYVCYACRNKIPIVDLEGIFVEQLKGFLASPTDVADYIGQAESGLKDKEALVKTLSDEQVKNGKEMDRLYRLYMDEGISRDSFTGRYRTLEDRQKGIGEELPRLQAELDLVKINLLSSEEIINEVQDLYSQWPSLPSEEKRSLIEAITEQITIGKDEVHIALNYLPSSADLNAGILATRPQGFIAAISWTRAG
jgi:site-specific DNA recombinase